MAKDYSIGYKFTADGTGFKRVIGDMNKSLGSIKKSASVIGLNSALDVANKVIASTRAVVEFTKESAKLAAEAEGITAAFQRLGQPGLLADLQRATRGTVDNVVLMQKAVQANNFKIPLSELATFFEFATKRAIQTGESVDYLVNSIVTGIGRKSVLVMDNLGISSVQLQEEVAKIGDFGQAAGNIIRRELTAMGDVADTTTVRMQQTAVAVKNLKLAWGEYVNQSKGVGSVVQWVTDELKIFADKDLSLWEKLNGSPNEYKEWKSRVEHAKEAFAFFNDITKGREWQSPWGQNGPEVKEVETLTTLNEKLKEYKDELNNIDVKDKKLLESTKLKIFYLEEYIKKLTEVIHRETALDKIEVGTKGIKSTNYGKKVTPSDLGGLKPYGGISKGGIEQMLADNKFQDDLEAMPGLINSVTSAFIDLGNATNTAAGQWLAYVGNLINSIPPAIAAISGLIAIKRAEAIANTQAAATGAASSVAGIPIAGPLLAIGAIASVLAAVASIPKYASGTTFAPGGLALVGERGPELVNLPRGSQVIPNKSMGGAVRLQAVLRGRDIYLSGTMYQNMLNTNT